MRPSYENLQNAPPSFFHTPCNKQVFSLAYGSVHEEVNSLKRGSGKSRHKQEANLVARVAEEGVTFRSYR